ncbi:hypothetical protein GCM10009430_37270 [Aquimarina litoralis]|uniref:DUF3592 domain-containing protein n=1 Tax=Aquimarina litoralis TaxID=584605 RepID=A0ABP3UBS7_9FLAO
MENLLVIAIFFIVGGVFIYIGYYFRNKNIRIESNGVKTKATIIDFVEKRSKDSDGYTSTMYYPIVKFYDTNGIEKIQELDYGTSFKSSKKNMDIIYLKKNDTYEIIINNKFWKTYFPMIFIEMGYFFCIITLIFYLYLI